MEPQQFPEQPRIEVKDTRRKGMRSIYDNHDNFRENITKIHAQEGQDTVMLSRNSQIKFIFGCKNCWHKGTDICPFGFHGRQHHTDLICTFRINEVVEGYHLIGSTTGKKLIRDMVTFKQLEWVNSMMGRLNEIKQEGALSEDEFVLSDMLLKYVKEFNEKLDRAIKQDEGTKTQLEITHSHDRFRDMVSKAGETQDVEFTMQHQPEDVGAFQQSGIAVTSTVSINITDGEDSE